MPKRLFAVLAAVLWLFLTGMLVAHAQSPVTPQVLGVVSHPGAESLGLDVYFVVTDADGRPILRPNLDEATIQLVGSASAPVPATVGDPQSDIYVVLLLDTSGSMRNTIGLVHEAASSALESLPPNARVSVIKFDDRIQQLTDFTGDLGGVQSAINRARVEGRGTCLYDAVWDAIDRLDRAVQQPQDRRALILFTDGRDQLNAESDDPCSIHTFQDVVDQAQRAPATPVHTIGLCGANCNNINRRELQEMAVNSGGFSVTGGETNLQSMFQEIMDSLNAQLVASANVFARKGNNQAALTVIPREGDSLLPVTFPFVSDKDYTEPLPPADVSITDLVYDREKNAYLIALSVANPQTVSQLNLRVEETDGGKRVEYVEITPDGKGTLQTSFSGSQLAPSQKYTIKIQAVDKNGFLVERKSDISSSANDDPTILALKEFSHTPPQPKGVEFTIESVNPDYQAGQLVVDLTLAATGGELIYQGFIKDSESGQKIAQYDRKIFTGNQISLPIPEGMGKGKVPLEYELSLTLETKGDDPLQTSSAFEFKPPLRPKESIFRKAGRALQQNPIFLAAIFAFIAAILAYRYYQGQQAQKRRDEVKRPPVSRTQMVSLEPPQMRLKLRVLRTTGQALNREAIISEFPYIIGRNEGNFTLPDDKRMSRKHAQITAHGNEFFIEDLTSTNHTFLAGEKLEPGKPMRLKGAARVRFGPDTEVEIEAL